LTGCEGIRGRYPQWGTGSQAGFAVPHLLPLKTYRTNAPEIHDLFWKM
jgi:hypothetical protein